MILINLILVLSLLNIISLLLYPVIVYLKSVFVISKKSELDFTAPVSIIIACQNEEDFILNKINSFLVKEEWIEESELIVVSNSSTDNTNTILTEFENDKRVIVCIKNEMNSKIEAVNYAVSIAKNEIIVFSDCRQEMKMGSVSSLLSNFENPKVGTVTAKLDDGTKFSLRKIFNFIAINESKRGTCLNVFGALYAQRKSVFRKIPNDLLFDDLFVVVSTINQDYRVVMEESAVIYDIGFTQYYQRERIERLIRGLLLFISLYYKNILTLKWLIKFRFIVFKYSKITLPFSLVFVMIYFSFSVVSYDVLVFPSLLILPLFLIKNIRSFFFHFFKIMFYTSTAFFQFIFLNKRSNKWIKLGI